MNSFNLSGIERWMNGAWRAREEEEIEGEGEKIVAFGGDDRLGKKAIRAH